MAIRTYVLPTITAVGSAGTTATGTQTSDRTINGLLRAIKVVQANSPHANTDITITISDGVTTLTLLTLTDNNTASAWYYPMVAACSNVGAAINYATSQPIYMLVPLDGRVTATVAQGGSAATCVVTFQYEGD